MNTFLYRDARKQKIQDALAALGDAPSDLRALLQTEIDALQNDDWSVSDRTFLAVGSDWIWSVRLTLKSQVDDDPALSALGQQALLSEAQAAAIESLPHSPDAPPPDYLDQVRVAIGGDEAILQELLHAGHRRWIVQAPTERAYPFDDVGVLLPLRLETLFDEPASRFNDDLTRWKLSLRVIPDEASICRDNHHVSIGEQKALTNFWNAVKQLGASDASWLDGDAAGIAWQQLCNQVTPARAAWLAANLETQLDGENVIVVIPPDMPDKPQPNRVGGMPPELHVVAITHEAVAGRTEHTIGSLPMAAGQKINAKELELPLPAVPEDERKRWWSNWEAAKSVGLGGEWLMPEDMTPENIDALYVVGIGDETPESHFKAQVDAGELGVLRLGAPTNSVHGKASADLGKASADWRKIAQMRLRQQANPAQNLLVGVGRSLQQHLIGSENDLPIFLGADSFDDTQDSQRMVQALWPALWGHWLLDLWQVGEDAYHVGNWMMNHLCPEGPLMPLRIGDQPYGVLPVTALSQWQTRPTFNQEEQVQAAIESTMAISLSDLCAQWAAAVKDKRSVVGKTTEQFMELLGQDALSRRYIQRKFSPAWVLLAPYISAFGLNQDQQQEFLERSLRSYHTAIKRLGRKPKETFLANGFWRRRELPLVQPTRMIYRHRRGEMRDRLPLLRFVELLFKLVEEEEPDNQSLEKVFERLWVLDEHSEYQLRTLPDSLLIRLLVYSTQLAAPWRQNKMTHAQKKIAEFQANGAMDLSKELDQEAWQGITKDEATGEIQAFTITIPDERRSQLERALRATLDSAAHRIDPWITGFAWQRLKQHSASPRRTHRLGVYGWTDGPFKGAPGPTDAGRLHTPSYNQTLAALILRDKFLSSRRAGLTNDGGRNPWEMNISSRKARLAEEIADEVRMGFHIYEIVGRHVENIVGVHQKVKELRINPKYAMRPERLDPHEVCNGIRALVGLLKGGEPEAIIKADDLQMDVVPSDDPNFPLSDEQRTQLRLLHLALDTYGDLLMADGVMQLVNRQVDRAAETMDAAAGFSRPPSFEFTRTPPSGYQLESVVISTLPYLSIENIEEISSPIRLADPSVAAFIDTQFSDDWAWTVRSVEGDQEIGSVTLAALGFAPHETLALSADFLSELVRRKLGLEQVRIYPPRQHALVQQLVAALGSRPAAGRDFNSDPAIQQAADASVYEELRGRYQKLHASCTSLTDQLQAAADDVTRALLLRHALIWGVVPISEPADREAIFALLLGSPIPETTTPLTTLTDNVIKVLQKRLDYAPKPAELASEVEIASPLDKHEERKKSAIPDGIPTLAQAIANLASPNSKLAILACWTRGTLVADSKLAVDQAEEALDETWLTVAAPTRANLARLEALQLEMNLPLTTWSSSPGDPWQKALITENLARRDTPHEKQEDESALGLRIQRFTAAYGTAEAWAGEKVAVGMIDAFSEAIPMPHRTSTAAFGFNAPAARAPQAILLAVPPKPRQRLDNALVQQIVAETRQLAHARTARMEDLGEFQPLTPTMWLQSSGPTRVHLEPYPLFE
jgi:hypothetical protein